MRKNTKRAGLLGQTCFLPALLTLMLSAMLCGCTQKGSAPPRERQGLQGAWTLQKIVAPDDSTHEYHVALYRIYDEDGMLYEYQLLPLEHPLAVLACYLWLSPLSWLPVLGWRSALLSSLRSRMRCCPH